MLCNRCLPFLRLRKDGRKKEPHIEKRGAQLISQTKIYSGKEARKRTLPRRRLSMAVEAKTIRWGNWPPTLIQPKIPHITQGCESIRSYDTRPMYRVPQVPQKTQLSKLSFLPSLAFLRFGNAEDVRLRFYRQFRLCFTTTDFGGRKGIGLSPYPYAVGVTSFDCERNITTVFSPSIYSYQKG